MAMGLFWLLIVVVCFYSHKYVSYSSIIHYLLIQIFINTVLVEYQAPEKNREQKP